MAKYQIRIRRKNPSGAPEKGPKVGELGPFDTKSEAVKQAQHLADSGVLSQALNILVEAVRHPRKAKKAPAGARMSNPKRQWWLKAPGGDRTRWGPFATVTEAKRWARENDFESRWSKARTVKQSGAPAAKVYTGLGEGYILTNAFDPSRRNPRKGKPATKKTVRKKSLRTHKGHKIRGSKAPYTVEPYGVSFSSIKDAKAWLDHHVAAEKRNPGRKRRGAVLSNPWEQMVPSDGPKTPDKPPYHSGVKRYKR